MLKVSNKRFKADNQQRPGGARPEIDDLENAGRDNFKSAKAAAGSADGVSGDRLVKAQATVSVLSSLVDLEVAIREIKTKRDLEIFTANELVELSGAKQVTVFSMQGGLQGKARLRAISGCHQFDPDAPLVRALESMVARHEKTLKKGCTGFRIADAFNRQERQQINYPYEHGVLALLMNGEQRVGLILFARKTEWTEPEIAVIAHGVGMINHACEIILPKPKRKMKRKGTAAAAVSGLVLAALIFIKLPLIALAPVEVVPLAPIVMASPLDGVVREMLVTPNQFVKKGEPLVQIEDTDLRNQLELAEREVEVSRARYDGALHSSFSTPGARRELIVAQSMLAKARTARDYALERFSRTRITAAFDGIAVYNDANDWRGKPVVRGEKILELADPERVRFRIDLAMGDSIALKKGARVRVFLDADPLNTRQGRVEYGSYHAVATANNVLSYRVYAGIDENGQKPPRIGLRGTAQIYGDKVALWFYLLRRPLSAARQWIGW